jgi:fibronectin type 3 domain-containing protein
MRRRYVLAALVGGLAVLLLPGVAAQGANGHANYHAVCPAPAVGYAHCHALVVTDAHGNPNATSAPTGLSPSQIKDAYSFSTSLTAGTGTTIAIVDAYDDPNAESDLNVFSNQYGLPACTTANSCFKKVNQSGGTSYPSSNAGWALEISLDVQWAHAIAPGAHILLVEANSNSFSDLLTAEQYAAAHAGYVSNSWGGSEFSSESAYDGYFSHSGTSYFVSAGDAGLPAEYPSASPNVISVGGTTLHLGLSKTDAGYETGWSSGGGGCSSYESPNAAQSTGSVNCHGTRATPDVSLDADPNSGVAVYDSVRYYGQRGWWTVGGTSASSPMVAARSAVEGAVVNAAYVYGSYITYRDITSGNNGAPCLVGYDLCTGRGSWTGSGGGSTAAAPDPPTGLAATGGAGVVSLSWSAPNNDGGSQITGYEVRRSTSSGGEQDFATLTGTGTSYDDYAVTAGTTYYYEVEAVNAVGPSAPSGEASATTPSATVPGAPSGLAATGGDGVVHLSWTAPSDGGSPIQQYEIDRTGGTGGGIQIFAGPGTTYDDTSVTNGYQYTYDVKAINGVGTGPASTSVSATPAAATKPVAPTNLSATQANGRGVQLTWSELDSSVTSFNVYRGDGTMPSSFVVVGSSTTTSYKDTSTSRGSMYTYYVVAINGSGQSDPSDTASATAK